MLYIKNTCNNNCDFNHIKLNINKEKDIQIIKVIPNNNDTISYTINSSNEEYINLDLTKYNSYNISVLQYNNISSSTNTTRTNHINSTYNHRNKNMLFEIIEENYIYIILFAILLVAFIKYVIKRDKMRNREKYINQNQTQNQNQIQM